MLKEVYSKKDNSLKLSRTMDRIMENASDIARRNGQGHIGTGSLLVALMQDRHSLSFKVLTSQIKDESDLISRVSLIEQGMHSANLTSPIRSSPMLTQVLEDAEQFARRSKSGVLNSAHVFLALLSVQGVAARLLRQCDVDTEKMRADLLRCMETETES